MSPTAARLDDVLAGVAGKLFRRDLAVAILARDGRYSQAIGGAWLCLTAALALVLVMVLPPVSWTATTIGAALVAPLLGMSLLRLGYDRARGRYEAGSFPFIFTAVASFVGLLAAFQPVG